MTQPSWLPSYDITASGIETDYLAIIPGEFPQGLGYLEEDDSNQIYQDNLLAAHVSSWIRNQIYSLQKRYFPQEDSTGWLISYWEDDLGLEAAGTTTQRINRILLGLRARGTATKELLQTIIYPMFSGEIALENAGDYIDVVYPSLADAWGDCIQFHRVDTPTTWSGTVFAVDGVDNTEAFACGQYAQIMSWDGTTWTKDTSISGAAVNALTSFVACEYISSNNIWVGGGSYVYNWDGSYWNEYTMADGNVNCLTSLPTTSGNDYRVYVAGTGEYLEEFYRDQRAYYTMPDIVNDIKGVVSGTDGHIWGAGITGNVFRFDSKIGSFEDRNTGFASDDYNSICVTPNGYIQVNGDGGCGAFSSDFGTTWTNSGTETLTTPANLTIYGGDGWHQDRNIIVGTSGTIFRHTGDHFNQIHDPSIHTSSTHDLKAVWVDRTSCTVIAGGEDENHMIHAPSPTEVMTSGVASQMAKAQSSLHFYSLTGNHAPDYTENTKRLNRITPLNEFWTTGSGTPFKWGDALAGWGEGCWE